ncbi:hypothetical protein HDV05_000971 [Chytridiales sp. JEL 0842]|nr:hypothetical protein HDV05_000971 [Chytridiales sp. JEL 0842]
MELERALPQPKAVRVFVVLLILLTRLENLSMHDMDVKLTEDSLWEIVFSIAEQLYCVKKRMPWRREDENPMLSNLNGASEDLSRKEAGEDKEESRKKEEGKKKPGTRSRSVGGGNGGNEGPSVVVHGASGALAGDTEEEEIEEDIHNEEEEEGAEASTQPPPFPSGRGPDLLGAQFDKTLPNMLKLQRNLVNLLHKCGKISQDRFVGVCTLLLDIFDRRDSEIWGGVQGETIFRAERLTAEKCRKSLSVFSAAVLIEVQYITACSQRLLNSYCMIYYSALALANSLNLTLVLKILRGASQRAQGENSKNRNTNSGHIIPSDPACQILQALQLIFHQNLTTPVATAQPAQERPNPPAAPSHNRNGEVPIVEGGQAFENTDSASESVTTTSSSSSAATDFLGGLLESRTTLRESLMSFQPGTLNSETAELISQIIDHPSADIVDEKIKEDQGEMSMDEFLENVELSKCFKWLREVVRWQKAGRQLEPVKELLRKTMGRIDYLRGVQREYGIAFMD